MRESFVFHLDYIDDLPPQYKAEFMQYTVDYGLYGKTPPLSDDTLESALWAKIKRRIDKEAEKYEAISNKRRAAAQKRYEQRQAENTPAETPKEPTRQTEPTAEQPKAEQKKPAEKFEKPTVSEIAEYCAERKNGIDAQAFFDFYESKGWKVGAVKMKDWRASVRTWEQRRKTEQTGGRNKAGAMWGKENEIPKEYLDMM